MSDTGTSWSGKVRERTRSSIQVSLTLTPTHGAKEGCDSGPERCGEGRNDAPPPRSKDVSVSEARLQALEPQGGRGPCRLSVDAPAQGSSVSFSDLPGGSV